MKYTVVMLGKDYAGQDCGLARALEMLGERWTLLIVRDAFYGVRRFTDFQTHLDVPKAVLAERLTGLVDNGILARRPDPARTGRHVYELTPVGRDLWPILYAYLSWSERHGMASSRTFHHARCDTALDQRGDCPHCGITPDPRDVVTVARGGRRQRRRDPVAIALRRPHRLLDPLDLAA